MAVLIGNASISENGTIRGKAGDQTGKEVTTRKWYKHSKGWVTLKPLIPGMDEFIAEAMEKACANPDIGYNQYENGTLWNDVAPYGYDPSKTTKKVNTDCARLVRLCIQYACVKLGLDIIIPDFYTATMANVLVKTGLFEKLTDSKYNTQDAYLQRGWPQVTKTKGHAIVVLENGSKAGGMPAPEKVYALGERALSNGAEGADVKELQLLLIQCAEMRKDDGYLVGSYGADGDFGNDTEKAVIHLQLGAGLEVDGIVEQEELDAINAILDNGDAEYPEGSLRVIGSSVNIRSGPGTEYVVLDVAHKNDVFRAVNYDGWQPIEHGSMIGWISDKYTERV